MRQANPRGRGGNQSGRRGRGGNRPNQSDGRPAAPPRPNVETPDHSPIGDIEGTVARLGDIYIINPDSTSTANNLYNHYGHQYDIVLPADSPLKDCYTAPLSIDQQIAIVAREAKIIMDKEKRAGITRIVTILLRCIVALPTKTALYAGLVAQLGIDHPPFLKALIQELSRQLDAALNGLYFYTFLHGRKAATSSTAATAVVVGDLSPDHYQGTSITTPVIAFELLLRFVGALTALHVITPLSYFSLCFSLLHVARITPTLVNFDTPVGLLNALPCPLQSLSHTIVNKTATSETEEEKGGDVDPSITPFDTTTTHSTTKLTIPPRIQPIYTPLADTISHAVLGSLVFCYSDLIPASSQLYDRSTNHFASSDNTLDADVDHDLHRIGEDSEMLEQLLQEVLAKDTSGPDVEYVKSSFNHHENMCVAVDDYEFQVSAIESNIIMVLIHISTYLSARSTVLSQSLTTSYAQNHHQPLLQSPFATLAPFTWPFHRAYSQFNYPALTADANTQLLLVNDVDADHYFDYLTWSYFSITKQICDGRLHLSQSAFAYNTSANSNPQYRYIGILQRPYAIPSPAHRYRKTLKQYYLKQSLIALRDGKADSSKLLTSPPTGFSSISWPESDCMHFGLHCLSTKVPDLPRAAGVFIINNEAGASSSSAAAAATATTASKRETARARISKDILKYLPQDLAVPQEGERAIAVFISYPQQFTPILPTLPQHTQMLKHANPVDTWLVNSYLEYALITYDGLNEEFMSFLSSLPPVTPMFGSSQSNMLQQLQSTYVDPTSSSTINPLDQAVFPSFYSPLSVQPTITQSSAFILVDHLFARLLCSVNQRDFIANSGLLVQLMYQFPKVLPRLIGPRFYQIYSTIHHYTSHARYYLGEWLASHLDQFGYQWPWSSFKVLNTCADFTNLHYLLMRQVLTSCIQLSYFSAVAASVRDLWNLLPPPTTMDSLESMEHVFPQEECVTFTHSIRTALIESIHNPSTQQTSPGDPDIKPNQSTIAFAASILLSHPLNLRQFTQPLQSYPCILLAGNYHHVQHSPDNIGLSFLTQPVALERVSIVAVPFTLAILSAGRFSLTHLSYYLSQFGAFLSILANMEDSNQVFLGYGTTTIDNDAPLDPMDVKVDPSLEAITAVTNMFTNANVATSSGLITTVIQGNETVVPTPSATHLVILDTIYLYYSAQIQNIIPIITLFMESNIISIASLLVWVLFYLPRYKTTISSIYSTHLRQLLFNILDSVIESTDAAQSKVEQAMVVVINQFNADQAAAATTQPATTTAAASDEMNDTTSTPAPTPSTSTPEQRAALTKQVEVFNDKIMKLKDVYEKIQHRRGDIIVSAFTLLHIWSIDMDSVIAALHEQSHQFQLNTQRSEDTDDANAEQPDSSSSSIQPQSKKPRHEDGAVTGTIASTTTLRHAHPNDIYFFSQDMIKCICKWYNKHLYPSSADLMRKFPFLDEEAFKQIFH